MQLELIRESENKQTGAISGRLLLDGEFYGYTLEDSSTAIAPGTYKLGTRWSPKFLRNKVEIIVPGRKYLMFHGGNTPADSSGCVLLAARRIDDSTIQGDVSDALYNAIKAAAEAGNASLVIKNPFNLGSLSLIIVAAVGLYVITR